MSDMGMFGHVPTPAEAGARAFTMDRDAQEQWSWASYCCGLSDAGVPDGDVLKVLMAACNGEFSHNIDSIYDYELDGDDE